MMEQTIKTPRLVLCPLSTRDEKPLEALLLNEQIKETYLIPDFQSRDQLEKMVSRFLALSRSDQHFVRGIYLDGELIGFVNDVDIQQEQIELGYVIDPTHWGRGYATEALSAVLRHLVSAGFRRVETGAFAENTASIRVMEKCGMKKMAKTETIEYRGRVHHCVYYGITPK